MDGSLRHDDGAAAAGVCPCLADQAQLERGVRQLQRPVGEAGHDFGRRRASPRVTAIRRRRGPARRGRPRWRAPQTVRHETGRRLARLIGQSPLRTVRPVPGWRHGRRSRAARPLPRLRIAPGGGDPLRPRKPAPPARRGCPASRDAQHRHGARRPPRAPGVDQSPLPADTSSGHGRSAVIWPARARCCSGRLRRGAGARNRAGPSVRTSRHRRATHRAR